MAIQEFFNDTGTLKGRTGYDQYGKEVQSAGAVVSCRFQETTKTRINPDGSVEPIDAYAFFDPSISINAGDHFVVTGVDYRVLNVNQVVDGRGLLHHLEVNLQKWQS
jgi:hypothetical protein